jgi:hypothetical protein
MTSSTRRLVNKSGGTADESVVTSGSDDDESLATLDSGGRIALIALVLINCERLASNG